MAQQRGNIGKEGGAGESEHSTAIVVPCLYGDRPSMRKPPMLEILRLIHDAVVILSITV